MIPPTITPLPAEQAMATLLPNPTDMLVKRQSIVTLSITASQSPTAVAEKPKGFPVAVAIPALVGGMAVAIGGFILWWWISKRRRREKRLRWEAHQRKMQARKKSNATSNSRRPSASAERGGQKSPIDEKGFVPPVPALPKHAHQPQPYQPQQQPYHQDKEYGHRHHEYSHYTPQPSIEPSYDAAGTPSSHEPNPPVEGHEPKKPAKSSRSAARVAAAEKAAEAAHGDVNTRYQPKKPSPLAIKAQEAAAAAAGQQHGDGPFGDAAYQPQQHLDPSSARQVSGEWGVALGSPNHDGSFSAQQQVHAAPRTSYSNDPYLTGVDPRARSGVYSDDPYASYHGDEMEEVDYHQVAADPRMGLGGKEKMSWV